LSFIRGGVFAGTIDKSKANKIKAGLLYNMTKMVTWPESSFKNNEPISILFLGKDYVVLVFRDVSGNNVRTEHVLFL